MQRYEVVTLTVPIGATGAALPRIKQYLDETPSRGRFLACWYSDIGAVNQILIIRTAGDAGGTVDARFAALNTTDPFGIAQFIVAVAMDTYVSFDFIAPLQRGTFGPVFEVRSYVLKPGGLPATVEAWRKAVPARLKISPVLAAMTSVTGAVTRFLHVWPYKSFDERARLREKAMADRVWPPPGGPDHLASQQVDIYLPAPFSPIK